MNDDQFTRLFVYMNERFDELSSKQEALRTELKGDISRVYDLLDADLKQRKTDEQERLAINSQLGRHEDWIAQLANKTSTHLKPAP